MAFLNGKMYPQDRWTITERSCCSTPGSLGWLWVFAETRDTRCEKVIGSCLTCFALPWSFSITQLRTMQLCLYFVLPSSCDRMKVTIWRFWQMDGPQGHAPSPTAKQSEPRAGSGLLPPRPPSHPSQCPAPPHVSYLREGQVLSSITPYTICFYNICL